MRTLVVTSLLVLALSHDALADALAPGDKVDAAKKMLQHHGYEVDALKYGLAIASDDKNVALDFCRIDDDITLVISYDQRNMTVVSLALHFIPDNCTSKLQVVIREALEITFDKDGIYTVKLRRRAGKPKTAE